MKLHICIVTGEPLANLIPILQEQPDRIALAVSKSMESEARRFQSVLNYAGWSGALIDTFDALPDSNYEIIAERALEIEDTLRSQYPEAEIAYNATGGNKLMALAFMAVFDSSPASGTNRIIYTDTQHRNIESIRPKEEPTTMESVMSLAIYLKAQGKTLRSRADEDSALLEAMQQRKSLTKFLARHTEHLEGLIGQLNTRLAPTRNDSTQYPALELSRPPKGKWFQALQQMESLNLLSKEDDNGQHWTPTSKLAVDYLTGGWLEEYAWFTARDCGADDVALSLKFTDDYDSKSDIRNEVDIAVLHWNRLLLIECKTGNATRDGKDQEIVYKLDSLVEQVGGRLGKGMLVSFKALEHTTRDGRAVNTGARAASVDLLTCEQTELAQLGQRIQQWLQTPTQ